MKTTYTLALYILILLLMGLYGFLKTGSAPSIVMSTLFSAALAVCLLRLPKNRLKYLAISLILITALTLFFAIRWWLSAALFPSGVMTIVSAVFTLLLTFYLYHAITKPGDQ